jgi:CSLREA domain-containing protein
MSSLDSPRPPQSTHARPRRANGARRTAVFLVALCALAASASLFAYVRGRAAVTTYYSRGSLPPEVFASWSDKADGTGLSPTDFTSADVTYVIQDGHNMTTAAAGWSVSGTSTKVEIQNGGTLTSSGSTDTFPADGTVTLSADTTFKIDAGGTYVHDNDAPYATTIFQGTEDFDAASTVELRNSDTAGPSGVAFGNLTVNFTTDPGGDINCDGGLTTINGNLSVKNTQSRKFALAANNNVTLGVGGDLSVEGGTLDLSTGTGTPTVNLSGNYTHSGGTLTDTGSNVGSFNFTGGSSFVTFNQTGGTLTNTNIDWSIASGKDVQFGNSVSSPAFTNAASRTFTINSGGRLDAAAAITNSGAMNVNGEFRLTDNGSATGNAFVYDPAATLSFVSTPPYVVGDDPYWPTSNGPGNIKVLGGGMTLNVARTVSNLFQTFAGVTLNATLTLNGTCRINAGGFFNNSPTYGPGSTLEYDTGDSYNASDEFPASGAQNVALASTTQLNLNGDKSIAGTFAAGSRTVGTTGASPFSLSADTITVSTGTLNLNNVTTSTAFTASGAASVNVAGNWNVAGFSAGTSTVNFDGAGAQVIQTASAFNNLTASNDISLGASPAVGGLLALGSHKITTGANTLGVGGAGSVTHGTGGYIIGNEQKTFSAGGSFTFDVGTANGYSPVEANSTTGTGSLSVKPTEGKLPNISGTNALSRYWTLAGTGVTTNLTFHYLAGDVVGTESNYQVFKYDGTFSAPPNQSVSAGAHTATVNGVSSFSEWTLAEPSAIQPGSIQFSSDTYADDETNADHDFSVVVTRTGGADGAVSVDYSITPGTAALGSDYSLVSPATGTLTWPAGNSDPQNITINVKGDTLPEPDETVNFSISNPQGGAALGTPSAAVLTITNDDIPPSELVVNTTADPGDGQCTTDPGGCTLREAINAANFDSDQNTIRFRIPDADPGSGHFYYKDDGSGSPNGHVTAAGHLGQATAGDDALPADADPDWRHSWWSIKPATPLPAITSPVTINGYSQTSENTPATQNTKSLHDGDDAVLRVELDGSLITSDPNARGLDLESGAEGSTISGLAVNHFAQADIYIEDDATDPLFDTISGNFLGTDISGTLADGTAGTGVTVNSGEFDLIGGDEPKFRNLISGHSADGGAGISISVSGHTVEGNYIGTDKSGTAALGNEVGVNIHDGSGNVIGCTTTDGDNVISGNTGDGIKVTSSGPNFITGNFIGTTADGTHPLGNGGDGISLYDATNNVVGSDFNDEGDPNTIAFNAGAGVEVKTGVSATGTGNSIRGNFIHDNGAANAPALGIDLGGDGVTENDSGDADTGPNNFQNFPVLSALTAGATSVGGTLDSYEGGTFKIDVYANPSCDSPNGNGEGQTFIGSATTGVGSFSVSVSGLTAGQAITATATDSNGNTSEFSKCVAVNEPPMIVPEDGVTRQRGSGSSNSQIATVNDTESGAGGVTVTVTSANPWKGVTLSKISNDGSGHITADIAADCSDPSATADFTLTATDGDGATSQKTLTVTVTAPEIDVKGNGNSIADGDSTPSATDDTDFGNASGGGNTVSHTFTVANTGTAALSLTGDTDKVVIGGANASDFTVTAQPSSPVASGGGTTTFTVKFTPGGTGPRTATVSIADDDCDENPYDFAIQGTGVNPDYTVTTGASIVVTDVSGNGDTLAVSEPGDGQIKFAAAGRFFLVDGTTLIDGNSGDLPLSNVASITVNQGGGDDTANVGPFTSPLPNLTVNGGDGDDTVNFNGSITFAPDASLDVNLQNDPGTPGTDSVNVAEGAQLITSGAGTIDVRASKSITVRSGGLLQTQNGNLTVEANQQGSATAGDFNGVDVLGGTIQATGSGSVGVSGTGGTGGTLTHGVNVGSGGAVNSKDGQITVNGTGGSGAGSAGFNLAGTGTGKLQTTGTGSITVNADRVIINTTASNATIDAGGNGVTLRQKTAGTLIDLGSTSDSAASTLELSDAELDRVTAGTLSVGDANSGAITVSAAITRPASTNLNLTSGGAINLNASSLDSGGGDITLAPGSSASVTPAASGTDVSMSTTGTLAFSNGADLAVAINGTTADTQYAQLNVVGKVKLTGVDLVLSGSPAPAAGQHYVIVNNDGADAITGNFNGLPEGATLPNFFNSGFDATISYNGGDGNDAVITVNPLPTFSVDDVSVNEGDSGTTDFTFTITKSGSYSLGSSVRVDTADGTASSSSDYTAVANQVVPFASGDTTKKVTVSVNGDAVYEHDETFFVNLSNPTGATILDGQGRGTILNDDAKPTLTITPSVSALEGNSGTKNFTFTVTKSGNTDVDATVSFATADGTTNPATGGACGTAGVDYASQSGTLTFHPADPLTKTVVVSVCGDTTYEADETFFVNLSSPVDATITNGQGVGTIRNDDKPPSTLTVNTTDDNNFGACFPSHCSLREAILAANFEATFSNPGVITINFQIPAGDPNHFYYADDTSAGHLTRANVTATAASDDTTIAGIDPDWPHSWWTISPQSALPSINATATVDGYSQPTASANTSASADNAVLRIELNGAGAGVSTNGLSGSNATLKGFVVNRFGGNGINLVGNLTAAGNFVGTDASGTLALANGGTGFSSNGFSNTVGGATPAARNLVSGNTGDGLSFAGGNSLLIQGNLIGTKADGATALGNGANGVSFTSGAVFNVVGGANSGEGNTIAFNGGDGVHVDQTAGTSNSVRGNSIHDNGTTANHLGIDLGGDGVTTNDSQDADTGANNLQNFPVITSALRTGSTKTITGTLNSTPHQTFIIDFYASPSCDTSGNGEGQTYLGSLTTAETNDGGDVQFTFHPTSLNVGDVVTATATATDPSVVGSTSEFSQCVTTVAGSAGTVQFSQSSYTAAEPDGVAHITFKRVGGSDGSISATFSTADGTAHAGSDYTAVPGTTVAFTDGDTAEKTVDVTITNDSTYEHDETVGLSLGGTTVNSPLFQNSPQESVSGTSATLTITSDDAPPTFSVNDQTHNEGNSGTTDFTFTVTKSGNPTEVTATVHIATQDGSAVAPGDYQSNSDTLTFLPGDTTQTFTVLVNGDTTEEPQEDFTVHLSSPSEATISDADGTGTIKNDDNAPVFSINDVTHFEGNAGTTDYVFTVTKTGATAFDASVDFATADGTATTADNDYQSNSGTLDFAAAETTKTVTVHVNGDTKVETNETFKVVLTNALGATIGDDTGLGTINNDEESVSTGQLIISEFRLRGPGAAPTTTPATGAPAQVEGSTPTAPSSARGTRKAHAAVSYSSPQAPADTSPQANDEFIELYNNTDSPLLVTTTDGSSGWALAASDGVVRFVVPQGTVIPARGHFLGVNTLGYSLSAYPAGNDGTNPTTATGDPILLADGSSAGGYTLDIPDNVGIALFSTATPANFSTTTRLDAAGSTSESNTLYKEGAGYPALSPSDIAQNLEHSFYRSLCSFQFGVGCTTPGLPKDTGDNAADFLFVDTKGTPTAAGQRLGAPGPENLSSHIQRTDQQAPFLLLDRSTAPSLAPNRVRNPTPDTPSAALGPFGTLSIRRRVTNNTGRPVVQLRFRIIEITTLPAPPGTADLRALSSGQITVSGVGDPDTCGSGPTPCAATVEGTTLEQPPTQLSNSGGNNQGGGFNSSLSVGTITLLHPLAPGDSVNVQVLLGVRQTGAFRILANVEAVTAPEKK